MNCSETDSPGIPLLVFGGVAFVVGLIFTVGACVTLKKVKDYQGQVSIDSSLVQSHALRQYRCQLNCVALLGLEGKNCYHPLFRL